MDLWNIIVRFFQGGGEWMYPIALVLVAGLAIALERETRQKRLERDLGIKAGETTADGEVSLETVNCLGACALGPLVTANETFWGNMTVTKVDKMLGEIRASKGAGDDSGGAA